MSLAGKSYGDFNVEGVLTCRSLVAPASCIDDAAVKAAAAIDASKLQHQHRMMYSQPNSAATTETKPLYLCYGTTGVILDVHAGSIAAAVGAATVTIDIKKNGTSILTGATPITLNSSNTARVAVTGSIATSAVAANDLLEVVIVATAGGGTLPTGVFVAVTVNEKPS